MISCIYYMKHNNLHIGNTQYENIYNNGRFAHETVLTLQNTVTQNEMQKLTSRFTQNYT